LSQIHETAIKKYKSELRKARRLLKKDEDGTNKYFEPGIIKQEEEREVGP